MLMCRGVASVKSLTPPVGPERLLNTAVLICHWCMGVQRLASELQPPGNVWAGADPHAALLGHSIEAWSLVQPQIPCGWQHWRHPLYLQGFHPLQHRFVLCLQEQL